MKQRMRNESIEKGTAKKERKRKEDERARFGP
jgi:hypothetical protein